MKSYLEEVIKGMKRISYQEFKTDVGKYLKEIPLEITMFGKPYAVISKWGKSKDIFDNPNAVLADLKEDTTPPVRKFDWEIAQTCLTCNREVPVILMEYHLHIKHGL